MTLTPYRLAALHLLESADLDVLPTLFGWAITDPEQPSATALIASGDTLAAAIDAALPGRSPTTTSPPPPWRRSTAPRSPVTAAGALAPARV